MFLQELKFSTEVQRKYLDAQSRARFHFGAEVERYLEQLRREMIHSDVFDRYGPPQGALAARQRKIPPCRRQARLSEARSRRTSTSHSLGRPPASAARSSPAHR